MSFPPPPLADRSHAAPLVEWCGVSGAGGERPAGWGSHKPAGDARDVASSKCAADFATYPHRNRYTGSYLSAISRGLMRRLYCGHAVMYSTIRFHPRALTLHYAKKGTHGPALLHERLLPADAECPACPLLPRAGAARRPGFCGHEASRCCFCGMAGKVLGSERIGPAVPAGSR